MKAGAVVANAITGIAVLCSMITTAMVVRKASAKGSLTPLPVIAVPAPRWREVAATGHWVGPTTAPVVILEFGDFECPACRSFATTGWAGVHRKFGDSVALVFREWPLPYHRFAYGAAVAAECASEQGKFEAFYDFMYGNPDSLGIESYKDIGATLGVADLKRFEACVKVKGRNGKVDADIAAAKQIGGTGTPTLVIDGNRYSRAPDSLWLDSVVTNLVARARIGSGR